MACHLVSCLDYEIRIIKDQGNKLKKVEVREELGSRMELQAITHPEQL